MAREVQQEQVIQVPVVEELRGLLLEGLQGSIMQPVDLEPSDIWVVEHSSQRLGIVDR
jgi:hypothetical protein